MISLRGEWKCEALKCEGGVVYSGGDTGPREFDGTWSIVLVTLAARGVRGHCRRGGSLIGRVNQHLELGEYHKLPMIADCMSFGIAGDNGVRRSQGQAQGQASNEFASTRGI